MIRRSLAIVPPAWAGRPIEEEQSGWPVIQAFEGAGVEFQAGLTDLSHRPKALVQGPALAGLGELEPGQARWTGQAFVGCLKPGEAALFDLGGPLEPAWPDPGCTDMTEAWVLLGLWGPRALGVMQRLVAVDVERPAAKGPFYLVTSSHGLRVQILNPKGTRPGFLLAGGRSQGQNLYDSLLHAGGRLGLKPQGEKAFRGWFDGLGLKV